MICKKCSYEWNPKIHRPKECPNCKTRNFWDDSKCFICENEITPTSNIHHIDCNPKNNSASNLINVCIKCNKAIHHPTMVKKMKFDEHSKILLKKYSNIIFINKKTKSI